MKYRDLINELYKRRTKGIKPGLDRVLSILAKLGNPHYSFKSIHVAGTNGKGSVSKIIYSLLKAHGLSVGLFTSPHLTRFSERIIVNDQEISADDVVRLIEKIKPFDNELTFFEYVTVISFVYFKEKKVDYAVLETGMGGRLDATNVVKPQVSVITSIGLDHQEFLGKDIVSITKEKAGIIKNGVSVVSSKQEAEAEKVLKEKAERLGCKLFIYDKDFSAVLKTMSLNGLIFDFYYYYNQKKEVSLLPDLFLPLTGLHQLENASVALKAFITIYPQWNEKSVREGLSNIKMSGRLEVVSHKPLIIFDIAHNPHAAKTLVDSLKTLTDKKPILVFGMMRDKDVHGFIKYFEEYAYKIIFTVPHYERALKYNELLSRLNGLSPSLFYISEPMEAFNEALNLCRQNTSLCILCTGSTYLIGEIKEFLGERALHRTLGEFL